MPDPEQPRAPDVNRTRTDSRRRRAARARGRSCAAALLVALLLLGVSGCGQKGDLYLPDEPQSGAS